MRDERIRGAFCVKGGAVVRRVVLPVSVAAAAVLAGVVLVLGAAGAGSAAGPVATGEIVFARTAKEHGRPDLYVMAADSSHVRLLIRNAAEAAVSPNGRRVAFVRESPT
jgi:hypothetical protein